MKSKTLSQTATALVVAGGSGQRMYGPVRKQYLPVADEPILIRTLRVFDGCGVIRRIILVVPPDDVEYCDHQYLSRVDFKKPIRVVPGGAERQASVYQGLLALAEEDEWVVIHDAVRPFISEAQIEACVSGAVEFGACIVAIPVQDTVKEVDADRRIVQTISRQGLWLAQTPQAFSVPVILNAHERAIREGITGTDDASLLERLGVGVQVIAGSRRNIKITTPEDLELAEALTR